MAASRRKAVIDAPVEKVWALVGDPRRYPEWAGDVIEVTGLASVEEGAEFQQTAKAPLGRTETTYRVEKLDDLHEIKLQCQRSGYYSYWRLTSAQSSTYAEIEIGIEPTAPQYRLLFATVARGSLRRTGEDWISTIQRLAGGPQRGLSIAPCDAGRLAYGRTSIPSEKATCPRIRRIHGNGWR